jgi:GNAT superfamily N-acetyltransferase
VWDTFAAIIHEVKTGEKLPWWRWSNIRKKRARFTVRRSILQDLFQIEKLSSFIRQRTIVSQPDDYFQINDYRNSSVQDEVWVAEKSNMIVGFVSANLPRNFIHNLFVHPNHQRRGIGTKLLQVVEANLRRPLTIKIIKEDLEVSGFYKKHGWYQVSVHDNEEEPYVLYRKD